MGEDLMSWRARIGTYCHKIGRIKHKRSPGRHMRTKPTKVFSQSQPQSTHCLVNGDTGSWEFCLSFAFRSCLLLLLVISMSVETNPGPRRQNRSPFGASNYPHNPHQQVSVIAYFFIVKAID